VTIEVRSPIVAKGGPTRLSNLRVQKISLVKRASVRSSDPGEEDQPMTFLVTKGEQADAMAEIDRRVIALRKADPSLTRPVAVDRVLREDPWLYGGYRAAVAKAAPDAIGRTEARRQFNALCLQYVADHRLKPTLNAKKPVGLGADLTEAYAAVRQTSEGKRLYSLGWD
jgi:hypothetical protein